MSWAAEAPSAVVAGARGLVGRYLLPRLRERGFAVQAITRGPAPPREGPGRRELGAGSRGDVRWVVLDLERPPGDAEARRPALDRAHLAVHAAPLWLLPGWLPALAAAGVRRLVAFSSTSRFTKASSGSARERETARRIAAAEDLVAGSCPALGIRWTILRPTLVYGGGHDRNVGDIARFVRRFGFYPLAGEGRGGRQPVHAADLAAAAVAVVDNPATFDRAYDTPGGETLSYREMVIRIGLGVGCEPRLVRVPRPMLRMALAAAARLPRFRHLTAEVADRMDEDLVFDAAAARRDFGYDPRPFRYPDGADLQASPWS